MAWVALAILSLAAALGASAQAQLYPTGQLGGEVEKLWNIHGGASFMLGDTDDSVEPIVGIEYARPAGAAAGAGGALSLSADYVPVTEKGDTKSLVPILLNYKKTSAAGARHSLFGGIGVGAFWASDDIKAMDIDSGLNFAWDVILGVNLSSDLFTQARFIAGSKPGDDGMIAAELGYRF